ncbi:hypothetical protein [Rhizobium sp. RCC_161_2]|uniref:hypothetical protein n=1 Tax=Rhizobium sp. RCC_161_2 TaxID=3239219 RepID=UPI00352606EB
MREKIENLIEQLIELLDRFDGDPDIELDPAEDGIADWDGLLEQLGNHGTFAEVI